MQREIAAGRLADLTLDTKPLVLTRLAAAALATLPNVDAFAGRSFYSTRAWVGGRRVKTFVVGVPDFAAPERRRRSRHCGAPPRPRRRPVRRAERTAEPPRRGDGRHAPRADGRRRDGNRFAITGEGRNMTGGQMVIFESAIVLYATPQTVARLSGTPGVTSLEFRLRDPGQADRHRRRRARLPDGQHGVHRLRRSAVSASARRLARQGDLQQVLASSSTS